MSISKAIVFTTLSRSALAPANCQGRIGNHRSLKVVICGDGDDNQVLACAAVLSQRPCISLSILTLEPSKFNAEVTVDTSNTSISNGKPVPTIFEAVTAEPNQVVPDASIIILAGCVSNHHLYLSLMASYINKGAWVGSLYGQGGFDWIAKDALGDNFSRVGILFAFQSLPWKTAPGSSGADVTITKANPNLSVATIPCCKGSTDMCARVMSFLFFAPCRPLPNFLNVTLAAQNQMLAVSKFVKKFRDWDGKRVYTSDQLGSRLDSPLPDTDCTHIVDRDIQLIREGITERFPSIDLSGVTRATDETSDYAKGVEEDGIIVSDPQRTREFHTGFLPSLPPVRKTGQGWVLDLKDRLYSEHFNFGLFVLKGLATLIGANTPGIDRLISWHQRFNDEKFLVGGTFNSKAMKNTGSPTKYNLSVETLVSDYLPQRGRAPSRTKSTNYVFQRRIHMLVRRSKL